MYSIIVNKDIKYLKVDRGDLKGVKHLFTTRHGDYKKENSDIPYDIVTTKQTHSDNIYVVTDPVDRKIIKDIEADAIITSLPNTPIGILTADCLPILIFNRDKKIAAAVHAGREGTFKEITKKTVEKMLDISGGSGKDMTAIIGPGIGRCCYNVSDSLLDEARKRLSYGNDIISKNKNGATLDLSKANEIQLKSAGISSDNILSLNLCTACNTHMFYSYRREETTGRFISVIMIL